MCSRDKKKINLSSTERQILDWSKLKVFADDKIIAIIRLKFGMERVQNILVKGENAGNQHFLVFPQCFHNLSFSRVVNSRDCLVKS